MVGILVARQYFNYGTLPPAYRAVNGYVCTRVQQFLARRHKVPGRGERQFPWLKEFGEYGVHRQCTPKHLAAMTTAKT